MTTDPPYPCPFCGGTSLKTVVDDGLALVVRCGDCYAKGPRQDLPGTDAIKGWNRRSPLPAVLGMVEALKEFKDIARSENVDDLKYYISCIEADATKALAAWEKEQSDG